MKILYAEDEPSMADAVKDILEFHNYIVDVVDNGTDAYVYANQDSYDGIILDIMMPGLSGLEVLQKLRQNGCHTPILLLTAKAEIEDQIVGLDMGADDYLPKPFSMKLLLARLRAALRRREEFTPNILSLGNILLNQQSYELSNLSGQVIILPKLEYQLMELLLLNHNIYLSTEDILTKIWGYDTQTDVGTVWVYISNLRKKLNTLEANISIIAKRNIGYTLEVYK